MSRLPTTPCEQLKLDNQLCFALYSTSLQMTKVYKPCCKRSASPIRSTSPCWCYGNATA